VASGRCHAGTGIFSRAKIKFSKKILEAALPSSTKFS